MQTNDISQLYKIIVYFNTFLVLSLKLAIECF